MTYALDFRKKVLFFREQESLSYTKLSKRFGINRQTIFRWTKNVIAKTNRDKPCSKLDMESLKEDVIKNPDLYQYERAATFKVSQNCIHKALKRLDVIYKKNFKVSKSRRSKTYVIQNKDRSI